MTFIIRNYLEPNLLEDLSMIPILLTKIATKAKGLQRVKELEKRKLYEGAGTIEM